MIIDYAINNNWNYFVTITLDKKLQDRTDHKGVTKKLRIFLNHYKDRYDNDFKYILIPELHKKVEDNGKRAIHYHGLFLINNLDYWELSFKKQKDLAYIYRSKKITLTFGKKNEFTKIYNSAEFLSYYISKYITKNLDKDFVTSLNNKYFISKGLKKAESILLNVNQEIKFYDMELEPSFEHKFCKKWRVPLEDVKYYKEYLK